MSKHSQWILERRTTKEDHRLTVHVCLELVCLVTSPGHLGLQVSRLLLVLADLHGKSGGHCLCRGLHILLPLELALQEVDPLLGVITLPL